MNDILKGWNVTAQHLHRVKYPCDYVTDNYNPICPGIKGVTPNGNEGLFASPASWIVHEKSSLNTDA